MPLMAVLKTHSLKNLEESGIALDYLFNMFDAGTVNPKTELFNTKIFRSHYKLDPNNAFTEAPLEDGAPKGKTHENLISGKRVYPLMTVFPPTNRVLLKHIFNKLQEKQSVFKNKRAVLDVGCGSGILPIVFRKATMNARASYFCLDKAPKALESTRLNARNFELDLQTRLLDICAGPLEADKKLFAEGPEKFDFIISNPPWLVAKPIDEIDSGNYDPEERFLRRLFELVAAHLDKSKGTFWLVYSDLSEILGFQPKGRVHELCRQHGLVVRNVLSAAAEESAKAPRTNFDVIKRQSSYIIYEISF